jgi:hypothetical protein
MMLVLVIVKTRDLFMLKSLKMMALAHAHKLETQMKPVLICKAEETESLKLMLAKKVNTT